MEFMEGINLLDIFSTTNQLKELKFEERERSASTSERRGSASAEGGITSLLPHLSV
jgi:hypothetical protein